VKLSSETIEDRLSRGLGMLYAPPVVRDGILHRGVVSAEDPVSLASCIDLRNWVVLHSQHCARPPAVNPVTALYQCDAFFDHKIEGHPRVHAICRDFVDQDVYRPLGIEKRYDVVFNACWAEVKRPVLFAQALRYASQAGRPISCLWYGYHWSVPSGPGTCRSLEHRVHELVEGLPVTFLPTDWNAEENNRRFNSARVALLTSSAEGGPRVMSEAMLAGLPYLAAADVYGGSSAYLSRENRNGALFEPTARGIAECIWQALDTLGDFRSREWALANMCRAVAVPRVQDALQHIEERRGWTINWQDVDHDGSASTDWWRDVLAADAVRLRKRTMWGTR
jgi:glycosyltransferase involved in cell wall biosynthesis